jgi:hypothetical protein
MQPFAPRITVKKAVLSTLALWLSVVAIAQATPAPTRQDQALQYQLHGN